MATTVQESIDVHVPIRTAYNQWTQFESFPNFMDGVESIAQLDNTHTHWKIKVGGQEREFDAAITEQLPDERVAWKSTGGSQHAGVVTFHRISADDTRVTVQMDWQPEGFAEKAGAVLGADDRRVKADLRRFKSFIEERQTETGAWRGEVPRPDAAGGAQQFDAPAGNQGHGTPAGGQGHDAPAGGEGYGTPAGGRGYDTPAGGPGYGTPAGGPGYGTPAGGREFGDEAGYTEPPTSGDSARSQAYSDEPDLGGPRTPGSPAGGW
ncbi:SRPBCC family protein [Frankia sp. AgB32]|uniref:SRPBCC family protein n=1 Tax=Frankia sp. AgB32 TaxID=631119 RepID=UPI00200FF3B2|nr:SRPBCC family protein [Frankia sp. AgB32]MCK9893221.1 cyclase [Frankia sp. AgB32]